MSHVNGVDDGVGYGVYGFSDSDNGVRGLSNKGYGVYGYSDSDHGVYGLSNSNHGVYGLSNSGYGVSGKSSNGSGVYGESDRFGNGVYGKADMGGNGVHGLSNSGYGVYGRSDSREGVYGESISGSGVTAFSKSSSGVYGRSNSGPGLYCSSSFDYASVLDGKVKITGNLEKAGGSFKIDHPLDPANKYLHHSFVESPDMKNVYDGVVVLDNKGKAEIELPDWFGILNKDFRYQLTAIGAPGPNLYIAEEISDMATTTTTKSSSSKSGSSNKNKDKNNNSRFKIAGGASGMKVSWQVTGIRKDPWANANRIRVEEDKPAKELGHYLHSDLYGQPEEKGISHLLFPKDKREEVARALVNK